MCSMKQVDAKSINTTHHQCLVTLRDKNGLDVLVLCSKKPKPYNWLVCYNYSVIYFKTYREAMNYCKQRNFQKK